MINLTNELHKTNAYLKTVPVATDPFEHFLLRNPFSRKIYRTLLDHLPGDDAYDWRKGLEAAEHERGYFYLNQHNLRRLSPQQQNIWEQVCRWTLSSDFYSIIMGKYESAISERLNAEARSSLLLGEVKLIRDKANYALQPHTDRPNRVTTIMFYLPRDFSIEECGTAIYRPKNAGMRCSGFHRHSFDDFELVSKAPFVPNSGLCFLKTDASFHGVEPIERHDISRDFLTFSIRCVEEGLKGKARRYLSSLRGNQQNFRLDWRAL
jgi:hypothetical protein